MAHVKGTPFGELNERTIWRTMEGRMTDRAYMIAHFQRHIDEVRRTIPADRLLVFDVKQGWAPLCAFLGLAVPKGPFPRINTREKTRAMFLAMMAQGPEMDLNEKRGHVPQELFGGELK